MVTCIYILLGFTHLESKPKRSGLRLEPLMPCSRPIDTFFSLQVGWSSLDCHLIARSTGDTTASLKCMSYNKKIQLLDLGKDPPNKQQKRMVGILKRDKKCVTGKIQKKIIKYMIISALPYFSMTTLRKEY